MNYLALAQDLRRECRIPGSGPDTVIDQYGEALDLVTWINDAYRAIQQAQAGQWRWLRRQWSFNTVAGTHLYPYSSVTDVDAAAAISRPGKWLLRHIDYSLYPTRYLTSAGAGTAQRMIPSDIDWLRYRYDLGTHANAAPQYIAEDDQRRIVLRSTPDDIYTIRGWYMRGPQELALDDDVPEMPEQYHKLIVYEAMMDYAINDVAQEVLARAELRAADLWDALIRDQLLHDLAWPEPLA